MANRHLDTQRSAMSQSSTLYVGLDVHNDTIAATDVPKDHGGEVISPGAIGTRQCHIDQLVRMLQAKAKHLGGRPLLYPPKGRRAREDGPTRRHAARPAKARRGARASGGACNPGEARHCALGSGARGSACPSGCAMVTPSSPRPATGACRAVVERAAWQLPHRVPPLRCGETSRALWELPRPAPGT